MFIRYSKIKNTFKVTKLCETCNQIYSKLSTFFNTFDSITRTPIVFSLKKMGNSTLKLFIKIMRSWNINQTFSRHFKCVHSKNITEACRSCFGWFLWIRLNLVLLIVWFFSEWRFQQKYCEYIKIFETSVISVFIKNLIDSIEKPGFLDIGFT